MDSQNNPNSSSNNSSSNTPASTFQNPYAAPSGGSVDLEKRSNEQLAERGTRLIAVIIDGLAWTMPMLILIGLAIASGVSFDEERSVGNPLMVAIFGGLAFIFFIAFLVYQLTLMSRYGQTLGKRIMKIKVVDVRTGEKCPLGRYFWLRSVVPGLIGGIPFIGNLFSLADILFIFADDRRCIHDKIAETKVVLA